MSEKITPMQWPRGQFPKACLKIPNRNSKRNYKTELCERFENEGSCKYGENCQFAHGKHELREKKDNRPSSFKTVPCRNFWKNDGFCPYGKKCRFVHNIASGYGAKQSAKAKKSPKYRTVVCKTFKETGSCPFGDDCAFIHNYLSKMTSYINEDIDSKKENSPLSSTNTGFHMSVINNESKLMPLFQKK